MDPVFSRGPRIYLWIAYLAVDPIFARDPVITHGPRISLWTPYFNLAADPLFLVLDPYSGVDPVSNGDPVSNCI